MHLKMPPNLYNRKPDLNHKQLPDFYVSIVGSSSGQFDLRRFLATYEDAQPYRTFFRNIRGRAITELLSNHRRNIYCLYNMIDSGKVDDFGCLYPEAMAKIRPIPKI